MISKLEKTTAILHTTASAGARAPVKGGHAPACSLTHFLSRALALLRDSISCPLQEQERLSKEALENQHMAALLHAQYLQQLLGVDPAAAEGTGKQ